jgi:hypothetical protein
MFIARMAMTVEDLCVTAYVLSLDGRNDVRAREVGFMIPDAPSEGDLDGEDRGSVHLPEPTAADDESIAPGDLAVLDDSSSDDEIVEPELETGLDQFEPGSEELLSYRELQAGLFTEGDIEHMIAYPLYSNLMAKADHCIGDLAQKLGMSPDESIQCLHNWIEMAVETLRFPVLGDRSPDTIWRHAHQYDEWRDFSELAIRIITLGTSEADAERIISVHRDLASLKGTRYSHRTLQSRLQLRISRQ